MNQKKFHLIGFDIDNTKIALFKKGKSPIKHIQNKLIKKYKKRIVYENNFKNISNTDVIILCLETPLTKNFKPDLSYIQTTLKNIKKYLSYGQIIILESSTYPGSTRS